MVGMVALDIRLAWETNLCPSVPDQSARWHDLEQYPTEEHPAHARILRVGD
jgi:hypothetical protein